MRGKLVLIVKALCGIGISRKLIPTARVWARRSVFWRMGQPLLVAECFLPGFWTLTAGRAVPPLQPHQRTPGAR